MKDSKSRFGIFLVVVIVLVVGVIIGYFSGFFFKTGIAECSPPPGILVDGIAIAEVFTWKDLNGNGTQESGEPPLPWVTVDFVYGYPPSVTNEDGIGHLGKFKPGCACDCWEHESISVVIPPNYQATTPTQVELTGQENPYSFGFQPKQNSQPVSFPGELDWFHAFTNRGLHLTTFNYSASTGRLAISFDIDTSQDQEKVYNDIFNIVSDLRDLNISIEQIELTTPTLGYTETCEWERVQEWMGRISYSEIISSHCKHSKSQS